MEYESKTLNFINNICANKYIEKLVMWVIHPLSYIFIGLVWILCNFKKKS